MVHTYPVEWVLEASIPLLIWISFFAFGYMQSRHGGYKMEVNVLAILGAFLAFVSFLTGWGVIERGSDWSLSGDYALFLLFTYPLAVITPLAGIGQAGVLLWVLSYAHENNGSIEPFYGYLIAWISVMFMAASIVWPVRLARDRTWSNIYHRLMTLTIRRTSRPWMSIERTIALLFTIVFFAIGIAYLVLHKGAFALALVFVGLLFVWFMLLRHPRVETAVKEPQTQSEEIAMTCPRCGTHNTPNAARCVGCGWVFIEAGSKASSIDIESGTRPRHMAWILFVVASYLGVLIALSTAIGAFGPGPSGEEKTRILVDGAIALAVVIPLAMIAYRRAIAPSLPRDLIVASVTLFVLFMLMASLELTAVIRTGVSVVEYLVFAGIGLVGPALFHLQARRMDGRSSDRSSRSP